MAALAEANKLVVVPAFETEGVNRAPQAAFGGKEVPPRPSPPCRSSHGCGDTLDERCNDIYVHTCHEKCSSQCLLQPSGKKQHIWRELAAWRMQVAVRMWREERITMFLHGHRAAHGDTDFPRWADADAPYELGPTDDGWEPPLKRPVHLHKVHCRCACYVVSASSQCVAGPLQRVQSADRS